MCFAECDFSESYFKAAPNYCPVHPNVNRGSMSKMYWGTGYQYPCEQCILDCIKGIPDFMAKWNPEIKIDPTTVQVVLDVLDQKLGIF